RGVIWTREAIADVGALHTSRPERGLEPLLRFAAHRWRTVVSTAELSAHQQLSAAVVLHRRRSGPSHGRQHFRRAGDRPAQPGMGVVEHLLLAAPERLGGENRAAWSSHLPGLCRDLRPRLSP